MIYSLCMVIATLERGTLPLSKPVIAAVNCDRCGCFKQCVYAPELKQWVCRSCLDILLDILNFYQSSKNKGFLRSRLVSGFKWVLGRAFLGWVVVSMYSLVLIALIFIFPSFLVYLLYRLVRFRRNWRVRDVMVWVKTEHHGNGDTRG